MLKVGIIFPMQEEIDALKKYLTIEKEYNIFELTFYEGILSGVHVVLVQCGVGKVNAARVTQILIDNIKVDYIFNIGVAGGVDESLSVGDIVDCYVDDIKLEKNKVSLSLLEPKKQD